MPPKIKVFFDQDQWKTVRSALDILAGQQPFDDKADGLVIICEQWMDVEETSCSSGSSHSTSSI